MVYLEIFGGIYATCVANYLGIPPREGDIELPATYLDFDAMVRHRFLVRNEQFLQYRLIFDRRHAIHLLSLLLPFLITRKNEDMLLPRRRQPNTRGERRQLTNMPRLRMH